MITNKVRALFNVRAFLLLFLGFILALYASWMVSVSIGYGYSYWYGFYDSEQHIARYAPQNKYRQGFETTSVAEHKQLFQEIVESVHNNGIGLEDIRYNYGGEVIPLLHKAEVVHLQDVSNLINSIQQLVSYIAVIFIALYIVQIKSFKRYGNLISRSRQLVIYAVVVGGVFLTFLVFGPKSIFYQMHVLIFPPDHQWFFYYQDSLMSTMMKAPDLFAGIAFQIVLLGCFFFFAGLLLHKYVLSLLSK